MSRICVPRIQTIAIVVAVAIIATQMALGADAQAAETSPHVPIGALDKADFSGAKLRVAGWAMDPDISGPAKVHFYVDGVIVGTTNAALNRPDVAARHGNGARHGFDVRFEAPRSGTVCAWAINVGQGFERGDFKV
jgi:hypothetical protein